MATREATNTLTTVLSYPDRGPWGDASYRGNCSGHVIRDLLCYYQPAKVLDPMEGSGTTGAVCRELAVDYVGADLAGGNGLDMYGATFLEWVRPSQPIDFIFWHPPYGPMIKYSEHPRDISLVPVETFRRLLTVGADRLYQLLAPGGHLAVLIGVWRKRSTIYCFHRDLVAWKEPTEPEIIKVQHNATSNTTTYNGGKFIPILHEYLLIYKKPTEGGDANG